MYRPAAWLFAFALACNPDASDDKIVDVDGDGYEGRDDCDDEDAEVGPAQQWTLDEDGDGYGSASVVACEPPDNAVDDQTDCDDASASVNPGAAEVCDGIDNNCDGVVDEDAGTTFYIDSDDDGFGDAAASTVGCEPPAGYVSNADDCDDTTSEIYPGGTELCNEIDDDCDGVVDNDTTTDASWYADEDYDGYGNPGDVIVSCKVQVDRVLVGGDCDDEERAVNPGADEVCNGIDDDCNGQTDESTALDASEWYADADGDGFGDGAPETACDAPDGYAAYDGDCDDGDSAYHPGASEADCADPNDYNCDGSVAYADLDGDGWAACEECDDAVATNYPGATEVCDSVDNDCDGTIDEADAADASIWYADADADGYGDLSSIMLACSVPAGYVADATDCDDGDGAVSPGAVELCNGVDDDCDSEVDEDSAADAPTWYADADGDSYGDASTATVACDAPADFVADGTDCDDTRRLVHPGATEYCNTEDDDCDGDVDEAAVDALRYWADDDGDSYGNPAVYVEACSSPPGHVRDDDDCDDTEASINPDGTESCNGEDDDCNGSIDDGLSTTTWYADDDGDGYGGLADSGCTPPPGAVDNDWDCDDTDSGIYPGSDVTCPWTSCLDLLDDGIASLTDEYWIDFDGTSTFTTCDMDYDGGGWTLLFDDDFTAAADSGWSLRTTYACGSWGTILGGYGIIAGGTLSIDVSTYAIPHTEAWAEVDYIALDSWDGETGYVSVDGTRVWSAGINNHSSAYAEICGWNRGYYGSYDSKTVVSATTAHSDSAISFVGGSTLDQGPTDESFGLDNVFLWIR